MAGSSSAMGNCTNSNHYRQDRSMIRSRSGLWAAPLEVTREIRTKSASESCVSCASPDGPVEVLALSLSSPDRYD